MDIPQTHIVKWTDGEHAWSMVIKPGNVNLFTTAPVPQETLRTHADQWAEAFAFVNGRFADQTEGGNNGNATRA